MSKLSNHELAMGLQGLIDELKCRPVRTPSWQETLKQAIALVNDDRPTRLGVPNNSHADIKETLELVADRFNEDSPEWRTKPFEWRKEAIDRIVQSMYSALVYQSHQQLKYYDAEIWEPKLCPVCNSDYIESKGNKINCRACCTESIVIDMASPDMHETKEKQNG